MDMDWEGVFVTLFMMNFSGGMVQYRTLGEKIFWTAISQLNP